MTMAESVAAFKAAGLAAEYHRWDRDTFLKNMGEMLKKLEANPALEPRARFGLDEKGAVVLWHYLAGGAQAEGGDCEPPDCFDISHPCPPFC